MNWRVTPNSLPTCGIKSSWIKTARFSGSIVCSSFSVLFFDLAEATANDEIAITNATTNDRNFRLYMTLLVSPIPVFLMQFNGPEMAGDRRNMELQPNNRQLDLAGTVG